MARYSKFAGLNRLNLVSHGLVWGFEQPLLPSVTRLWDERFHTSKKVSVVDEPQYPRSTQTCLNYDEPDENESLNWSAFGLSVGTGPAIRMRCSRTGAGYDRE